MIEVNNSMDIIDSRDVIERIEELEGEQFQLLEDIRETEEDLELHMTTDCFVCSDTFPSCASKESLEDFLKKARQASADWEEDEAIELYSLRELRDQAEGYSDDWEYGEALIRDSYFKEYAKELADDVGAIDRNLAWPNDCIDWDRAARELQMDYTSVEFDGVTYWIR